MAKPEKSPPGDALMVCTQGDTAFVRVVGRGGFKVAPALRDFGIYVYEHAHLRRMVVDMLSCTAMDSTFMGVLAGLSHRFTKQREGEVVLVNINQHTYGLLTTLGLDRVLQAYPLSGEPPEITRILEQAQPRRALDTAVDGKHTRETMVAAHEALIELAPENEALFRDVLDFLRKESSAEGDDKQASPPPENAS